MILVDFSHITISSLMAQVKMTNIVDEAMLRHIVLNSLRYNRAKFKKEYGELVICCDSRNSWRKDIFPSYKINRTRSRKKSSLDWNHIFTILNKITDEIREYFPYKVLKIDRAEADDIIAVICEYSQTHNLVKKGLIYNPEKTLILSGDKDLMQLHKFYNIDQYSPVRKKFLRTDDPQKFLKEHIMRGDSGDAVPNFLSADDVFLEESKRQKPIQTKKIDIWIDQEIDHFCDPLMKRGFKRNEQLIDLSFVPQDIKEESISQFENVEVAHRRNLMKYFMKHRLKNLTQYIGEY